MHAILLGLLQLSASPFSASRLGFTIALGIRHIVDCGILPIGARYFAWSSAIIGVAITDILFGHQHIIIVSFFQPMHFISLGPLPLLTLPFTLIPLRHQHIVDCGISNHESSAFSPGHQHTSPIGCVSNWPCPFFAIIEVPVASAYH
jgi:hypothetical protein